MKIECQAILFDLDGTLVDSTVAVEHQWAVWAARHGIALADVLAISHGMPATATMRRLAPHIDVEAEAAAHVRAEEANTDGVVAVAGARELLSALPQDRWAVVTSCPRNLGLARLRAAGIAEPPRMVCAEDIRRGKPDPEPYLRGSALVGREPKDCLVFEDAPAGVNSALAAGMRVVGITTTFAADRLPCATAISDFRKLSVEETAAGLVVTIGE